MSFLHVYLSLRENKCLNSSCLLSMNIMKYTLSVFFLFYLQLSIYAQEKAKYIPYRKGKLWGLADTTGRIVLEPAYDEIDFTTSSLSREQLCYVKKQNKWGVITSKGKPILNIQFSKVIYDTRMKSGYSFFVKNDSLAGIYSSEGKELLPPKYRYLSETYSDDYFSIYVVYKGNKVGLYLLNWANNTATCFLKEEFNFITRNWSGSTLYFKTQKGNQEILYRFDEKALKVIQEEKIIRTKETEDSPINAETETVDFEEVKSKIISKRVHKRLGLIMEGGTQKLAIFQDIRSKDSNRKYHLQKGTKPLSILPFEFEKVELSTPYYAVMDDEAYVAPTNWAKIKQNGKWGVINHKGEMELLAKYEEIKLQLVPNYPDVVRLYACKLGGKWGLVDQYQQVRVPFDYEEFIFLEPLDYVPVTNDNYYRIQEGFVAKKDGLYGIITVRNQVIYRFQSDHVMIEPVSRKVYSLKKEDKYGLLIIENNKVLHETPPSFQDVIIGQKGFVFGFKNYYTVFSMQNQQGEFLGYADQKGFLYYED